MGLGLSTECEERIMTPIYFIPVGWTACSGPAYMLAGRLGVPICFIPVGWITHSGCTYMSAGML